jgi:hypothetical protein
MLVMPLPTASTATPMGKRPAAGVVTSFAVLSHATRAPTVTTAAVAFGSWNTPVVESSTRSPSAEEKAAMPKMLPTISASPEAMPPAGVATRTMCDRPVSPLWRSSRVTCYAAWAA